MNNILTNATILALLSAISVYFFQKWSSTNNLKRKKNKKNKLSEKFQMLIWPTIVGILVWVGIYSYQQFYRDDAKSISLAAPSLLEESKTTGTRTGSGTGTGIGTGTGTGTGIDKDINIVEPTSRMVSKGLNIPLNFDDDDLPSVFLKYNDD
jgi:hypothetical protein